MSRVAKSPIEVVTGVDVNVTDQSITVKGKIGEMSFDLPETISLEVEENTINVKYDETKQQSIALAGTTRALVNNMIIGVSVGFEKKLELKGVGYRAKASGKLLELTLGFSHHSITSHPALENITTECIYLDQDHSFTELKNELAPHREDITCFNVDITPNNWVKKFKALHHCCHFKVKHYTQPSPVFFQKSAAVSIQLLSTSKPAKQPTGPRTLHERAGHS